MSKPELKETPDIHALKKKSEERNAAKMESRVIDVLNGNEEPPNEFVEYLSEQAHETKIELRNTATQLESLKSQIEETKKTHIRLQGALQKTMDDMANWLARE